MVHHTTWPSQPRKTPLVPQPCTRSLFLFFSFSLFLSFSLSLVSSSSRTSLLLKMYWTKSYQIRRPTDLRIYPTKLYLLGESALSLGFPCGKRLSPQDSATECSDGIRASSLPKIHSTDQQTKPTELFLSFLNLDRPCGTQLGLWDSASRRIKRLKAKTQNAPRWISEDTILPFKLAYKLGVMLSASEAAYVHNCTDSSLHNLPVELFLNITAYLRPVARLIMQRVCSKFRAALAAELYTDITTVKDVIQLTFLLRRGVQFGLQDDYYRNCDLAPPNSKLDRLGCSGCRTTHEVENFSENQLSLSPKIRICKGLEASFRLCNHCSFSGQCILRELHEIKNAELFCGKCGKETGIYGNYVSGVGGIMSTTRLGFHRHIITMDVILPLMNIRWYGEITHDSLAFALRKLDAYICPHLRSSSPQLFGGRQITIDCPDYTLSEIRRKKFEVPCYSRDSHCQLLRQGKCVTWAQCHNQDCLTRYSLRRIWCTRTHGIVLEISRDLGASPTHPTWLAQIDELETDGRQEGKDKCKGECCMLTYNTFMNS